VQTTVPLALDPYGSVFVVFRTVPTPNIPVRQTWREQSAMELSKDWKINFQGLEKTADTLFDWSKQRDESIKYFSGTAVYRTSFEMPQADGPVVLDLGEVKNFAEVTLNGTELGTLWKPPFKMDITRALKEGENELEIRVTNLWPNRLIGDAKLPEAQRRTWTNNDQMWTEKSALLSSGLLGPVSIRKMAVTE